MRNLLMVLGMVAGVQIAAAANITVFTDQMAWTDALIAQQPSAVPVTETFDSGAIALPGLSVTTTSGMGWVLSSGLGQIANGEWEDQVGKNASLPYDTTQFGYSSGQNSSLYGFGGDWNISPSATGLELWANTTTTPFIPIVPDPATSNGAPGYHGWWGFVSDEPFTDVLLGSDSGATTYTLDNLVLGDPPAAVSATPEPSAAALLVLGMLSLAAMYVKSQRRA